MPDQVAIFSRFSRRGVFRCEPCEEERITAIGSVFLIGIRFPKRTDQKEVMPDQSPGLRGRPASHIKRGVVLQRSLQTFSGITSLFMVLMVEGVSANPPPFSSDIFQGYPRSMVCRRGLEAMVQLLHRGEHIKPHHIPDNVRP